MQRTWFGIDRKTNPFGFGCWQIAGAHTVHNKPNGWGNVPTDEALDILCCALESGIDFFDTAQGYNSGNSERLLGEAIRQTGQQPVVCTKIPLTRTEILAGELADDFRRRVQVSNANLKHTPISILLLHNPPDDLNWSTFDYTLLDSLVEEGVIGSYGVSSQGIQGAKNVLDNRVGTTLEWVFNLFERRPIQYLLPMVEMSEMNFIGRSPLSRGLLSPQYIERDPVFGSDDFRSTLPQDWIDWVVDQLRIFHSRGVDTDQIVQSSLSFLLHFTQVTSFVVGIRTMEQLNAYLHIRDNVKHNFDLMLISGLPGFYPKWT